MVDQSKSHGWAPTPCLRRNCERVLKTGQGGRGQQRRDGSAPQGRGPTVLRFHRGFYSAIAPEREGNEGASSPHGPVTSELIESEFIPCMHGESGGLTPRWITCSPMGSAQVVLKAASSVRLGYEGMSGQTEPRSAFGSVHRCWASPWRHWHRGLDVASGIAPPRRCGEREDVVSGVTPTAVQIAVWAL